MTCTLRGISRTNAASIKTTPMPSPTETPIYTTRLHWMAYAVPVAWLIVAFIL